MMRSHPPGDLEQYVEAVRATLPPRKKRLVPRQTVRAAGERVDLEELLRATFRAGALAMKDQMAADLERVRREKGYDATSPVAIVSSGALLMIAEMESRKRR